MPRSLVFVLALLAAACGAGPGARATPADWQPAAWVDEDTITLRTTEDGGEPHWFPVWLAVVDDELYVRLGRKASARIEKSGPLLGARIAGKEFDKVRWESVPDKAPQVASAIGDKYWSDVFIAWVPHPLTLRLRAE